MNFERELALFKKTLNKCRIPMSLLKKDSPARELFGNEDFLFPKDAEGILVSDFLKEVLPKTVYMRKDSFFRSYIYFEITRDDGAYILFLGPYLSSAVPPKKISELSESFGFSLTGRKRLSEYFRSLPKMSADGATFSFILSFCETVFETDAVSVCDVDAGTNAYSFFHDKDTFADGLDDTVISIKALEKRYDFENELMDAVSLGQLHKGEVLFSSVSDEQFEKRAEDPIRNTKNYCIIMNTLLRKAAERGGVHPAYLDSISSAFALKIENISQKTDIPYFMKDMFRSYCRLVLKNKSKNLSKTVHNTILLIDSDLSANLTLSSLAKALHISPGYLCSVFRAECGKTVSEYIRERRMERASRLLKTTKLQIQNISALCGIADVQYFSKLFKKHTGKTPKEYRDKDMREESPGNIGNIKGE